VVGFVFPIPRDPGDHVQFDLYLLVSQSDGGGADIPSAIRI
jgi:hypothetical protein